MRKGCLWGLGCVFLVATSPIWIPGFLFGLVFLLRLAEALLGRI